MNPHRDGMDHLLEIDRQADDNALLLTKALLALRMAKPVNGRAREQITVAKREITKTLKGRFAA